MRFEPARYDRATLAQYVRLFESVFPQSARFSVAYLEWLYQANPDGLAIGFDAWEGETLAAHYACIPCSVEFEGQMIRAMLSLNTATHPLHQGQGLFTQLALLAYEAAAAQGIQAVYGVANANSTPGFVRKLGFELVRPLHAKLGFGALHIDWHQMGLRTQLQRHWSASSLSWRMANPRNPVRAKTCSTHVQFFAAAKGWLLPAYAELAQLSQVQGPSSFVLHEWAPRLYLGLLPQGVCSFSSFADVPQILRPSPLNFIFRSLTDVPRTVDPDSLHISFLDFDAY